MSLATLRWQPLEYVLQIGIRIVPLSLHDWIKLMMAAAR